MPNFTAARLSASETAAFMRSPPPGCSDGEPTSTLVIQLALLALTNAPELDAEGKMALMKGLKWLAAAKPADTPQSDGWRLVLSKRLGRPSTEWEPLAISLL